MDLALNLLECFEKLGSYPLNVSPIEEENNKMVALTSAIGMLCGVHESQISQHPYH